MKYRESGMPDEQLWNTFFNPEQILKQLGIDKKINTLIDIGCGYGTFLIPASRLIGGTAIGIDIEPQMIVSCKKKVHEQHLKNIVLLCGDISSSNVVKSLEQYEETIDYVTLFNILHCEQPLNLLRHVSRLLNHHGKVGVIHWKDEETPRGPSMDIRPTPEIISEWATKVGLSHKKYVELPPYHFGLIFTKVYEEYQ
jgi:SAM-dependent methyltransferase